MTAAERQRASRARRRGEVVEPAASAFTEPGRGAKSPPPAKVRPSKKPTAPKRPRPAKLPKLDIRPMGSTRDEVEALAARARAELEALPADAGVSARHAAQANYTKALHMLQRARGEAALTPQAMARSAVFSELLDDILTAVAGIPGAVEAIHAAVAGVEA
jgi:hypothetical protein